VVSALLAAGCAGKERRRAEPPGPLVRDVQVAGTEAVEEAELVEYLNLRPTSVFSLGTRSYYVPGLEAVDRRRVKEVYAANGHYDAEVESFEVEVRRKTKQVRRQRAYVRIAVDEGVGTAIRKVRIVWVEPVHADVDRAAVRKQVTEESAAGTSFGVVKIRATAQAIEDRLAQEGFPYARVTEQARVDRRRHLADVEYRVDPGPRKRVTSLELEGLSRVPEDLVRREIEFAEGSSYSPGLMRDLERKVYGMGVFAAVTVEPAPRTEGPELTVRIRVQESKMQRIRLGGGLGVDPVRWDQYATAVYRHDNLFRRLYRFTARAKAGYAELPALYDPQQHGPIGVLDLELRKKGLLERKLVWTESPRFELGLWDGYQFYSVDNRIGVSRFFTRYFELGLSYNNRFVDLFNISPTLDRNRTVLGLDFRDPYVLAYVQLSPTLHLTDDILQPHNGVRLSADYDLASTYLGGQFDYHKIVPDLRAYWRPLDRLQLAARARVGLIFPYGRNPGAPIDLKFYLGGAADVRGWGLRRLSPRIELCQPGGEVCDDVPTGGKSMLHGSFETRVRTWKALWFAAFLDTGDVRDEIATLVPRTLMVSTGGGARYESEVGTFRLDVGVQLNEDPRFPEPRPWAIHFGIGEAF